MPFELADIDAAAWAELAAAAQWSDAGFRYLALCSVDGDGRPQARTVVLREVDATRRTLEFHTDVRSPKWLELSANPHATVLGFCPRARLQLRLKGVAECHGPGSERAASAWRVLPAWTRSTYQGGSPGDAPAGLAIADAAPALPSTDGRAHFGIVIFRAGALDWCQLRQQDNRRAVFTYGRELASGRWINP